MKRKYHIYTDASVKEKEHSVCGIIVRCHNIVEIYYKHYNKRTNSAKAEHKAVIHLLQHMQSKYGIAQKDLTIYTDAQSIANIHPKFCKWVRGHCNKRRNFKHRFNCLADYIAKNGLANWKEYWCNKL